jgi:hypothetical protein
MDSVHPNTDWDKIERLIGYLGEMTDLEKSESDASTPRLNLRELASEGWIGGKIPVALAPPAKDGDSPGTPPWPFGARQETPMWPVFGSDSKLDTLKDTKGANVPASGVAETFETGNNALPIPPPPPPSTFVAAATAVTVSRGSVGHPHTCAAPCRYVRRKGGCRDGADCPLCHVCLWQRASAGKSLAQPLATGKYSPDNGSKGYTSDAVAKRSDLKIAEPLYVQPLVTSSIDPPPVDIGTVLSEAACSAQPQLLTKKLDLAEAIGGCDVPLTAASTVAQECGQGIVWPPLERAAAATAMWTALHSIGSIGHPFTCSKPCKYHSKGKGCKDGANCSRCHICIWSRNCERETLVTW